MSRQVLRCLRCPLGCVAVLPRPGFFAAPAKGLCSRGRWRCRGGADGRGCGWARWCCKPDGGTSILTDYIDESFFIDVYIGLAERGPTWSNAFHALESSEHYRMLRVSCLKKSFQEPCATNDDWSFLGLHINLETFMFSNAIFWWVREKWTMDVVAFKPSSCTFQLQLSCWSSCSCDTKIIGEYHWASPSRDRRNGEVICKSRHRRSNSKFVLPLSFEVETFRIRGFCAVLNFWTWIFLFYLQHRHHSHCLYVFVPPRQSDQKLKRNVLRSLTQGHVCERSWAAECRYRPRQGRNSEPTGSQFERNTGRPQSAISPIQRIKCQFFKKIDPNWFVCVVFRGNLHLKLEVLGCIEEAVCICDLWEVFRWSQAAQDLGKICFRHVFETEDEDQGRRDGQDRRNGEHMLRWFYASWTPQTFLSVSGEGKAPAAQMVWGLPKWVAQVLNDHWKMSSRQDPFLKCFYGCACVGALMYQFF